MDPSLESPAEPPSDPWMAVARLLRPQGRRGELLAEPLTDLPNIFVPRKQLVLARTEPEATSASAVTIEDSWWPQGRNAGRVVLKLEGVDSISAAELLETHLLLLRESDLPALDGDTFLVRDLVGCDLFDGDRAFGKVVDLQFPVGPDGRTRLQDAVDLLVVDVSSTGLTDDSGHTEDGEQTVLVPFVKAWLVAVDLAMRRITMQLPSGLLGEAERP